MNATQVVPYKPLAAQACNKMESGLQGTFEFRDCTVAGPKQYGFRPVDVLPRFLISKLIFSIWDCLMKSKRN